MSSTLPCLDFFWNSTFEARLVRFYKQDRVTIFIKYLQPRTGRNSPPEVFLRKGVLKISSKFTGEHPCQSVILIKLQSNFIEITLRHRYFPVNLLHIFRTPFPRNTIGGLLLNRLKLNQFEVQRRINNPGKHLRWSFQPVTIFA